MGFQQRFCQSLGSSLIAVVLAISPAWAEQIENWSFDEDKSELTFSLPDTVLPKFFLLAEPPRLVLDVPAAIGDAQPDQNYGGVVQTIRVAQHTPEQVRVVIELAPDIELAPEQADIQFDDRDGQRHWRFRPLLAEGAVANVPASTPVATEPSVSSETGISRSAANLAIPESSATTAIPIDPYENGTSSQMVSVPPLEDKPILDSEQAAPDLPPMRVPVLEDMEDTTETVASSEAGSVALGEADADLPDLTEVTTEPQSVAAAPSENVTVDTADSAETVTIPVQPVVADEMTAAIPDAVAIPDAASTDEEMPVQPEAPVAVAETALAAEPVPESTPVDSDDGTDSPAWQIIQQPAAERTIVQTETPAPLTFGQPLPKALK